jgi:hypothetical protein
MRSFFLGQDGGHDYIGIDGPERNRQLAGDFLRQASPWRMGFSSPITRAALACSQKCIKL